MVKTVHVVPSIKAEASGPSYSVPKLCESLAGQGETVELHVLAPTPGSIPQSYTIHAHQAWKVLRRFGISPSMHKALKDAAQTAHIIHNHSLWMLPNIYPVSAVRRTRCLIVTSPRGTLSHYALTRSKWIKKVIWALGQGDVLKRSSCLHATSESEYLDIRQRELRPPVAIIPNGIEIPLGQKKYKASQGRRGLLFLGRIHPIKGIDMLIRAWARVEKRYPEWELHIIGPDKDGYLLQMQSLSSELHLERIKFLGPVYGREKSKAYWSADLFVLPTHSENFGLAVAEALAHGLPAIVSKGAPWSGLETHDSGWWIDIGEGPLTECLRYVLALPPEELIRRGVNGKAWMEMDFSWTRIGQMMHETYLWLLGKGVPPSWVRVNG